MNVIQAALNAAQATSENANEAASQAAGELGAQTAMVGAARQRLHALQEQLHGVRIDFEATQSAARKAQVWRIGLVGVLSLMILGGLIVMCLVRKIWKDIVNKIKVLF